MIKTKIPKLLFVIAILLFFTLPLYGGAETINFAIRLGILIISVLGLNIVAGFAGQFNLGQVAFMAVGAYTSSILIEKIGISFWIALPCAGLSAAIVGMLFGAPSLRLRGFYLAMSTLAAHFIIIWILLHWREVTGGSFGISAPRPVIFNFVLDSDRKYYYLILTILIIMTYFAVNLMRHRLGRILVAIRDNDLAAEMIGINSAVYKIMAFGISCFYAGIAGSLMGHWYSHVTTDMFSFSIVFWYYAMILVGGIGSNLGVFFGVTIISIMDELLLYMATYIGSAYPEIMKITVPARGMLFALVTITCLIFEPRGLAHRFDIIKARFKRIPINRETN
jgi:branched-chain amino acid transport system permease protein